jgi:hypothetical protein
MERHIKEIRRFDTLAADGSKVPIIEFRWVTIARDVNGTLPTTESANLLGLLDGTEVYYQTGPGRSSLERPVTACNNLRLGG